MRQFIRSFYRWSQFQNIQCKEVKLLKKTAEELKRGTNFDVLVKSQNLDGSEKCSRSRRANPEE
jgi:hypothetical protein